MTMQMEHDAAPVHLSKRMEDDSHHPYRVAMTDGGATIIMPEDSTWVQSIVLQVDVRALIGRDIEGGADRTILRFEQLAQRRGRLRALRQVRGQLVGEVGERPGVPLQVRGQVLPSEVAQHAGRLRAGPVRVREGGVGLVRHGP
jgi:hypothetical protein